MKRDVAKKWVAKLRSGEYEQGKGYLNDDGKMCCLGVLCEVAIEDGLALARVMIMVMPILPLVTALGSKPLGFRWKLLIGPTWADNYRTVLFVTGRVSPSVIIT